MNHEECSSLGRRCPLPQISGHVVQRFPAIPEEEILHALWLPRAALAPLKPFGRAVLGYFLFVSFSAETTPSICRIWDEGVILKRSPRSTYFIIFSLNHSRFWCVHLCTYDRSPLAGHRSLAMFPDFKTFAHFLFPKLSAKLVCNFAKLEFSLQEVGVKKEIQHFIF